MSVQLAVEDFKGLVTNLKFQLEELATENRGKELVAQKEAVAQKVIGWFSSQTEKKSLKSLTWGKLFTKPDNTQPCAEELSDIGITPIMQQNGVALAQSSECKELITELTTLLKMMAEDETVFEADTVSSSQPSLNGSSASSSYGDNDDDLKVLGDEGNLYSVTNLNSHHLVRRR